jgi:hypothetical protein
VSSYWKFCSTWDSAEAKPCKCIVIVCRPERVLPPSWAGHARHVPPLARMEPRFTGHGTCGANVKQRSRDAGSWTAGTAGPCSPWTPGTRAKDTGKQGTHERLAGRVRDQRNLEKCCRTAWGARHVNKAPSLMRGCAKGCARASRGTARNA